MIIKHTQFFSVPKGLDTDTRMSIGARFLGMYMFGKPDNWEFHTKAIAQEVGAGVDTIQRYIRELISNGWLIKEGQENNGKFGKMEYKLVEKPHIKKPRTEKPRTEIPCTENPCTYINNNKNKKDNKENDISNKETLKEKECVLFEQWWKAYGKKVGKKDTLRAWLRLKESEQQECLRVVCEYVASTPEVQYRKNPITYLHQRAWEDEIIKRTENTNDYGIRPNTNPAEAEREQRMRGYAEVAAQFLAEAERDRRERGIGGNIDEALPH